MSTTTSESPVISHESINLPSTPVVPKGSENTGEVVKMIDNNPIPPNSPVEVLEAIVAASETTTEVASVEPNVISTPDNTEPSAPVDVLENSTPPQPEPAVSPITPEGTKKVELYADRERSKKVEELLRQATETLLKNKDTRAVLTAIALSANSTPAGNQFREYVLRSIVYDPRMKSGFIDEFNSFDQSNNGDVRSTVLTPLGQILKGSGIPEGYLNMIDRGDMDIGTLTAQMMTKKDPSKKPNVRADRIAESLGIDRSTIFVGKNLGEQAGLPDEQRKGMEQVMKKFRDEQLRGQLLKGWQESKGKMVSALPVVLMMFLMLTQLAEKGGSESKGGQ